MSKPEITTLTDDIYNIKQHLTGLHALSEFDSRVSDVVSDEEG
ncbi:MAG: hypothetical protein ACJ71H_03080 [Nitrososphaeraceae archaeon]